VIKFNRNEKTVYDLGGKVNMVFGKTSHREVQAASILRLLRFARNDVYQVDYVSGCCMMIKREVFERIGFFDEEFFLYYEDVDFCLRAKKAGFKTFVLPSASVVHKLSVSVGKGSKSAMQNQIKSALIFGKKHIKHRFLNKLFITYQVLIFIIKNPAKIKLLMVQLKGDRF